MSSIVIAKYTKPRHYLKKNKENSKQKEYVQIAGAPLIVTKFNTVTKRITLNSLTSSMSREFEITLQELRCDFILGIKDDENFITNIDPKKYPTKVNISEFKSRNDFTPFLADIKGWVKQLDNTLLQKLFNDKLFQLEQTQGAPFENLSVLEEFKHKTKEVSHKRFGNQIFNRNCRWCPVADHITYDAFTSCESYPFPIGIRAKDFCLPSGMKRVFVEMIRQILTFKNVNEKYRKEIQLIFDKYNITNVFKDCQCHCCTYCSEEIDLESCKSIYKSENNYIEICHRDPNLQFCVKNMYWGHGECNRRQGGYTEKDRLLDTIGLIKHNPTDYDTDTLDAIIAAAQQAKQKHLAKTN